MTREGGGREGRSPKALELARVGKGVPQALLRNGIVATTVRVSFAASLVTEVSGHRHFPFGRSTSSSCAMRWRQMDFEGFEELGSALEPRVVGGDQLLAAVCTLLNETRALEHGDVFLHGGEAHLVSRSKTGHRRRFRERPRQDVPSRAIGQGTEQLVERLVSLFLT